MSMLTYAVVIEPLSAEEGGGYLAPVPDLPGCMSDGETPQKALVPSSASRTRSQPG